MPKRRLRPHQHCTTGARCQHQDRAVPRGLVAGRAYDSVPCFLRGLTTPRSSHIPSHRHRLPLACSRCPPGSDFVIQHVNVRSNQHLLVLTAARQPLWRETSLFACASRRGPTPSPGCDCFHKAPWTFTDTLLCPQSCFGNRCPGMPLLGYTVKFIYSFNGNWHRLPRAASPLNILADIVYAVQVCWMPSLLLFSPS